MDMPAAASIAPKRQSLNDLIEREKRRKRHRKLLLWGLLVLIPVAGIAVWQVARPKPVPLAARFRAGAVSRGDIVREVSATGHLEAITTVQVGAEISGRIASVEVDYNDHVTAGQVLASFDRAALSAQQAQMVAALAAARAAVEQSKTDRDHAATQKARADQLFASNLVSQSDRDNASAAARLAAQRVSAAEAQLAAQQASFSLAKTNLEHTIIRSPIDGVVITRNVDPGQTVASMLQTPVLFTVAADLRKMRVIASVDEADIGELAEKQMATFTVNAYPNRTFEGIVTEVRNSPQTVQDVVVYGTEVDVENTDLALKPGMTASVRIRTAMAKDVSRVPAAAFQFTPPGEKPSKESGLWLLSAGALKWVRTEPGTSDGELTAVPSGAVSVGASVIYELTPEGRKAYGIAH
ncbi:MAG TPA: efflux RND transporter periplasmic adaptor subunit [Polyangiaceae bacterium]|nr:efflux RND transporter periplasmic adaptor subunit [Polyangiaceae bacterium]